MTRSNQQHDIGIANASGTEIGFMLTRVKGIPSYREVTTKATAQRYATGSIDYGQIDPEEEISIIQSDFRGGFGLEYADSVQPKKYFQSLGVDTRFKDKVICGPALFTATLPTVTATTVTLTITNATMEADANWTQGAGTTVRSAEQAQEQTYSWKVTAGAAQTAYAYQDVASGAYASKQYTFRCWVYCGTASKARIGIDDGVTATYSSYHSGGSGWERLNVIKSLSASATKVELVLQCGASTSAYFDYATINQSLLGSIVSQCDFNGSFYIACGTMLLKKNSGGTAFTHVGTFPATITQLYPITVGGVDYLVICLGWSNAYWYMGTTEAFTETTLSNATAKYFVAVGATFYEADTGSTLRTTTSPLATAWSTQIQVGDDYHDITCLLEAGGLPYIMKQDKPFYRTSGGTITVLTDETTNLGGTTGGVNSVVWKGSVWMPYGTQGLLQYDISSSDLAWRSPAMQNEGADYFTTRIAALAGDDFYLYALIQNTTLYNWGVVMCLINEDVDGTSSWRWHTLTDIPGFSLGSYTGFSSAGITSINQKRLWIGETFGQTSTTAIALTTMYGSISSDTAYSYRTTDPDYTGYTAPVSGLLSPWFHCNLRGDKKAFYKLTLTMSGTTATRYWRVYYEKLGDSSWTEIDSTNMFKTSPQTTRYIPADGSSVNPQSTMLRLRFVPVANDTGINTNEALDTTETGVDCDADASTAIPVDSIIKIESELMYVTATGTTLTVTRGYRGTTAATHVTNTDIYLANAATVPVLLGFDLRAVWYPRQREVIYCQVELADNQPDKLVMDDTSTATRKTLLDELYNPATPWPRAFYPPYYVSSSDIKYVKALPPRDGQMSRWDKDRNPEYIYNLVLQVVPLS